MKLADNRKTISFKCSEEDAKRYKEFAEEHDMTQSDLLRSALNKYMREYVNNYDGNGAVPKHYAHRVHFIRQKQKGF